MYRSRNVNGIRLRRILIQVINRLNEISDDEATIDTAQILDDSDYEPSEAEMGELEIVELEEPISDSLTTKELDSLGYSVTKKANHNVNECSICLDNISFRQHVRTLGCNHAFHKKCIDNWFKRDRRCPICRSEVVQRRETTQIRSRITRSSVAGDRSSSTAGVA